MAVIVQTVPRVGNLNVQSLHFSKSKRKFWINEQYRNLMQPSKIIISFGRAGPAKPTVILIRNL
jgi:hypothetical protein